MVAVISPSTLNGKVNVPAGKSAMQRACALALMNKGQTIIHNPGRSNDDLAAIDIIKSLGAIVSFENDLLLIKSTGEQKNVKQIDCYESGLCCRMFAAIAALKDSTFTLTGTATLLERPMLFFDNIFPLLNVTINSNNGFLPVDITGPLVPQNISIDGSSGSQYLTGLLFAFAKAAKEPVTIKVSCLKSKPYIDISLQMLKLFGYDVNHNNYEDFFIRPVIQKENSITVHIDGDWSSASFLLVAGAISGAIVLTGLDIQSAQADKQIITVLKNCGADLTITGNYIAVTNKNVLKAFEFDATDCPDLFPPLVSLAANCFGTSVITGVSRLVEKESNRAETLVNVFTKMNVDVVVKGEEMIVNGGNKIRGANVSSFDDHRIAMACAVAALKAENETRISNAEAVNKSYPVFYDDLKSLGATVSLLV